ncbi:Dihydroorotate dehydrogenase B (NAD(+)), catalytic subunit [Polystyrenella longa]|uniref:Dihydroorotate dehydrogenase B (NAD(+)), catalytic subunit n=1 Tax=Polystyrenella longa TaxID=2528007 RepID=A0A518CNY2_9PLAN|nr:hypothetical protein [Polystyrenella longa]QDU80936.1 Dihydroorotate dehydrogenase B (NAD(+)), catalytic subunit [Polystyrenella longa]
MFPRYQIDKSYDWNYANSPDEVTNLEIPKVAGEWSFCGKRADSPLGIAAGPLLNGRWVRYYASLGFDLLTYKTVRSRTRNCYPLPNLQPVQTGPVNGTETNVPTANQMNGSWAVSFGMPSKAPDVWRKDVEETRDQLPTGKLLNVSVVGTDQPGFSLEDLAADYAQCAKWAVESGADTIEANLSCPNVSTCDGQLFQQPAAAGLVAATIRDQIGDTPLIIKVGHTTEPAEIEALVKSISPAVNACAMTNSVAVRVLNLENGEELFEGQKRGICGSACRNASLHQTQLFSDAVKRLGLKMDVIGVGGVGTAQHVKQYIDAGASFIQLATAAMVDPEVGISIRKSLSS